MCEQCEQFKTDISKDSFPTDLLAAIFGASITGQPEPTDIEGNTPTDVYKSKRTLVSHALGLGEEKAAKELGVDLQTLRQEGSDWATKMEQHVDALVNTAADALEEFMAEHTEKARQYVVEHMGQAEE